MSVTVVRDGDTASFSMLALFIECRIRRCHQDGCKNRPNVLVRMTADESPTGSFLQFGLCEEHYQLSAATPGEVNYELVFDEFDAFQWHHWQRECRERCSGADECQEIFVGNCQGCPYTEEVE